MRSNRELPPIPAMYPVSSPMDSADAATTATIKGFRSTATATHTAAKALTGRKIRAAAMKDKKKILVYPTVPTLSVPVVHSTSPVAMKATLTSSGVTRVRIF